jgi:hypothetical protein
LTLSPPREISRTAVNQLALPYLLAYIAVQNFGFTLAGMGSGQNVSFTVAGIKPGRYIDIDILIWEYRYRYIKTQNPIFQSIFELPK